MGTDSPGPNNAPGHVVLRSTLPLRSRHSPTGNVNDGQIITLHPTRVSGKASGGCTGDRGPEAVRKGLLSTTPPAHSHLTSMPYSIPPAVANNATSASSERGGFGKF